MTSPFSPIYSPPPRRRRVQQRPKGMGTDIFKKQGSAAFSAGRIEPNSSFAELGRKSREECAERVRRNVTESEEAGDEAEVEAAAASVAAGAELQSIGGKYDGGDYDDEDVDDEDDEGHASTDELFEWHEGDEEFFRADFDENWAREPTQTPVHERERRVQASPGAWGTAMLEKAKEEMKSKPAAAGGASSPQTSTTTLTTTTNKSQTPPPPKNSERVAPEPSTKSAKATVVLALPPHPAKGVSDPRDRAAKNKRAREEQSGAGGSPRKKKVKFGG